MPRVAPPNRPVGEILREQRPFSTELSLLDRLAASSGPGVFVGQRVLSTLEPVYRERFLEALAAQAMVTGSELLPGPEGALEKRARELRKQGVGPFEAARQASATTPLPRFARGIAQLVVDPLNLLPSARAGQVARQAGQVARKGAIETLVRAPGRVLPEAGVRLATGKPGIAGAAQYEVTITKGTIKPKGGIEAPFERTFKVEARTSQAAVKAVRDSGVEADKITVRKLPAAQQARAAEVARGQGELLAAAKPPRARVVRRAAPRLSAAQVEEQRVRKVFEEITSKPKEQYVTDELVEARARSKELGMPLSPTQRQASANAYDRAVAWLKEHPKPAEAPLAAEPAPGAIPSGSDVLDKLFTAFRLNAANKRLATQFLQNNVRSAFLKKFGDYPVMTFQRQPGGEQLLAISTAGWRERADEIGLQFVRESPFDDFYRIPPQALPERGATLERGAGVSPPPAPHPLAAGQGITPLPEPAVAVGGAPPVKPPAPPTGAPGPSFKAPDAALVGRVQVALRRAKRALPQIAREVTAERGQRAAAAREALARGERLEARGAFAGPIREAQDIVPIAEQFTAQEGEALRGMIVRKFGPGAIDDPFQWIRADTAFTKLWDLGQIPTRSELIVLEEVFGKRFIESVLSLRGKGSKVWELFLELWNVPRAMVAAGELSASLRQGAPFLLHGKGQAWRDAFGAQLKAFRSTENAEAVARSIVEHPLYESSQTARLSLTIPSTLRRAASIVEREEPFIGARLAANIPIYGKLVRASERAYVTMLNKLRFETFVHEATKLGEAATLDDFQSIAKTINVLTGRADLGRANEAISLLNGVFFAPRFAVSRFQAPLMVLQGNPQARKLAAQALVSYASTVIGMLSLADIAGVAEVEWDSRSSDFLKFKIRGSNTRIDPWAGLQQPVVLVSRLIAGQYKRLDTGTVQKLDAGRAITLFLENKLAPSSRILLNRGEGFRGEAPLDPSPIPKVPRVVFDNLVFIFVQDIAEAWQEGNPLVTMIAAPLSALGVGVQTFEPGARSSSRMPVKAPRGRLQEALSR